MFKNSNNYILKREKEYYLIKFEDENTYATIPNMWMIGDDSCYWPARDANSRSKDWTLPDKSNWTKYPCTIISKYG